MSETEPEERRAGHPVLVTPEGGGTYRVVIDAGGVTTTHTVGVPEGFAEELGWSEATEVELVRRSFAFLLEREGPASILRQFSLDVIGHYFPEYPGEIRR